MKTTTQHTPGPWEIRGTKEQPEIWSDADGGAIATLSTVGRFQAAETEEEIQANARLIAAAPELLATLKLFDAGSEEFNTMREDCFAEYGEDVAAGRLDETQGRILAKDLLNQRRASLVVAAIQKAEGRE